MVFESVVVELLNRFLKPYVKKLDTSQLKVAVWKGHASLDKLELKEDLFEVADLDVPLKIKRSFIGKLDMKIPWKSLTKEPLVIMIDDVFVIVGPNIDKEYNEEKELERQRREKEKKIEKFKDRLKEKKKLEKELKKGKKKKKESDKPDTFVEKLAVHLSKNLQVVVKDIHVRYEDAFTKPGLTMSAGATLHSLEVKSTDSNWVPAVVRETATVIYKLVELNCLGVYWNTFDQKMADLPMPTFIEEMRNTIARPAKPLPPCNAYLLSPVTASAKLKMNVKIDGDTSMPQVVGDFNCGDILVSLQQEQYKALLSTVEHFQRVKVNAKYLKYRPNVSVSKDKKAWWKYAITAMLKEEVQRRTRMWAWSHLKRHRELCVRYQEKWYEKRHSHSVSASLKEELQWLEDRLDWFNIMVYRNAADKMKRPSVRVHPQKPLTSSSQGSGMTLGSSPSSSLSSKDDPASRRTLYSIGSKEAKKEEKSKKEEQKAALKREEKARKEEEKARKEELKATKKEEKGKKEKKTSHKAFFSRLKLKAKGSKSKTKFSEDLEEQGGSSESSVVGGATGGEEGVADSESAPSAREESSWELVAKDDVREEDGDSDEDKARLQLYKEIGYNEDEESKYPKDYVGHEIHVGVNSFTLDLFGKTSKIGHLVTRGMQVDLLHRPANTNISMTAAVGSVVMEGMPHNNRTTTLVTSLVGGASEVASHLVDLKLDLNPLDRPEMDITVKAALRPIQITYDFETVNALVEMLKPPKLIHFQELTQAASASWDQLKSQTSASVKKAVQDRKQLELDVTLQSPFIVIPEKGLYTDSAHLLVADLGRLSLFGHTTDSKVSTIKTRTDALEKCYDTFTIKLDGMQVLVARPGDDWRKALKAGGSSPQHILAPSGFQISLLKSIVDNDAYLPSLRVEGTIPGFDVTISDRHLTSLVKVASSLEKPPALNTVTDAYDTLPMISRPEMSSVANLEAFSLDTISSGFEEEMEDDQMDLPEDESSSSFSGGSPSSKSAEGQDDITARHVFTDVSIKLAIQKVSLKLTREQRSASSSVVQATPLLEVVVMDVKAEVMDRKWDTQGNVTLKGVAIMDHITTGRDHKPVYLLKTESLTDGNFLSARFVMITRLGADFAAKYTGLQDTVSAQMSLVKIDLQQETLAALLQYAIKVVLPAVKPSEEAPVEVLEETDNEAALQEEDSVLSLDLEKLNPNDITGNKKTGKVLDLRFDAKFDGIDVAMSQTRKQVADVKVKGFSVNGRVQTKEVVVDVKITDLAVLNSADIESPPVVAKADRNEDIVSLKVIQYNHPSYARDSTNLDWVDTSVRAQVQAVNVQLHFPFLANMLKFLRDLNINTEVLQSAMSATAETATATASAIVESTKSSHRVKLEVVARAPKLSIPYQTGSERGNFCVDLGGFQLSNRFLSAASLESDVTDTISLAQHRTVMDVMEIRTSHITIYRQAMPIKGGAEKEYVLLEPLEFVALVKRNISRPTELYPNTSLSLNIDTIKFHLHESDVQAVLAMVEKMVRLLNATVFPTYEEVRRKRAQTLALPRARGPGSQASKRGSMLFAGSGRYRTANSWARAAKAAKRRSANMKKLTSDGKEIVDVQVSVSLKSVSLSFTTVNSPLFQFTSSELKTGVSVYRDRVCVSGSVCALSLKDTSPGSHHSNVLSLAQESRKASSLELTVHLDQKSSIRKGGASMSPLGSVVANLAQMRVIVSTPFLLHIMKFVVRLNFDVSVFKSASLMASHAAQDGAAAVSDMAHDKYFSVSVNVHAPVLIVPVGGDSKDGFMVDLGSVAIQNTLLVPDQQARACIDAFGIKLDSFKISRVLLDYSGSGDPVVAERVLLQPFSMLLALERNLCPWYTQVPTLSVNVTMGELGILIGQEDLKRMFSAVMATVEQVKPVAVKLSESVSNLKGMANSSDMFMAEKSIQEEGQESFEKFRVLSTLPQFELKLFKDEPPLSVGDGKSQDLWKCEEHALATMKLVHMDLKVIVSSQTEVDVQASMKDICLSNDQPETKKRNTGNRVIQHYTSNPLKVYTGIIPAPIISIQYILRTDQEHTVIAKAQNLLVLSDVEFMSTVANYFRALVDLDAAGKSATPTSTSEEQVAAENVQDEEMGVAGVGSLERTLTDKDLEEKEVKTGIEVAVGEKEGTPSSAKLVLPRLKAQLSVSNFRVAIIEDVYTKNPQALTLRVSSHVHLQLTEAHKHGSVSLSDLGVATSSFYDLDNTTSWVLLPCSINMSMTGPPDTYSMDINGMVEPISLTLSPAIVRLIIHAITTLIPKKEVRVEDPPRDLWMKQLIGSRFWFLQQAPAARKALPASENQQRENREESLVLTIESVEIILESDVTSSSPGYPVLSLIYSGVVQMMNWTGELSVSGDSHVEATYFNQSLSLWEPLLETVEKKNSRQEQWDFQLKAVKAAAAVGVQSSSESDLGPRPDFSVGISSSTPLQITITKTSLQLIKDLVDAYQKDYGKQVEGSVAVQTLTGSPYTVISKLGEGTSLFVQPGPALKLQERNKTFAKLDHEEWVDLNTVRHVGRKQSYTSLLAHRQEEEATVDIAVGSKFRPLKSLSVDSPGLYYHTLIPKEEFEDSTSTYGVVVDVAVTGTKKTITVRSPLQVKNHLDSDLEVLGKAESGGGDKRVLGVVKKDQTFPLPIDAVERHTYYVRPAGFGFMPVDPPITWQQRREGQHQDVKCTTEDDASIAYFCHVVFREDSYKVKKNLQKDAEFPHHVFHVYPPLVVQNLLPFKIVLEAMESGFSLLELGVGESRAVHSLDLDQNPQIRVAIIKEEAVSVKGSFTVSKKMPEYVNFSVKPVASGHAASQLSLHTEGKGYLKVAIYSPIWVINKTGLTLEYKEGNRITRHTSEQDMVLLATSGKKSKIQLRAITRKGSSTEWTNNFPVNAVGTSGSFSARLGENNYQFGVEVYLSQFALSKMVMITPYYLLVNKTKAPLQVYEHYNSGLKTLLPPGDVVPFWTLANTDRMVVMTGEGKESTSDPFLFKRPANLVLQFSNKNKVLALCVEVQESESANIVSFSPYYQGCIPVLVINHFPDLSLRFAQSIKAPVAYLLSARETLNYTWDDPQGKKVIRWDFPSARVHQKKSIDVSKDGEGSFVLTFEESTEVAVEANTSTAGQNGGMWVDVDESFSERLVAGADDGDSSSTTDSGVSDFSSFTKSSAAYGNNSVKGYWKSFADGIQRVLLFTPDDEVVYRIRSANSFSLPKLEASVSLKGVGVSLVDNIRKQELAYISVQPSGVIWQLDKGGKKKQAWKTLQNSVIAVLEQAYQQKHTDVKVKDLAVNLASMEMYSPLRGKLRRTHYEGVNVKFAMSDLDYSLQAKIGHVQIDNQLPFSVYPQMLYPLPPPPTVFSTTEPKPFVEASIILQKKDQSNVIHFKYVHVLVQKMSVNADLGFILSLVEFFTLREPDAQLEAEYVQNDVEYASKSLMETVVPELAKDLSISRLFFDVLHIAPIKINLSFNVRGVGKNKGEDEVEVAQRFLQLLLDSIGVILTSVQDIEMKFSLFHLEFQPQTVDGTGKLLVKHYRNQALFELYTLIFGLDVLGNPVSVVRGVVIGAKDLFYEPFKGSVLGPEEFFQGLGIGLRSFFGAGVVGGLTGAGARITGAFGDVFAKLSFDDEFIEQRQQTKTKPPKMGWKLGSFAKNVMEGVTGVVTQPVKGVQKEGAVGLLKGTGKGLVGLLVRPAGGLVDLASGTLEFVTRKTKVGTIEISDVRPPRFIGRDGAIRPYSPAKAVGTALLVSVDEGAFVGTDYYKAHLQVQLKPPHFAVITDRRMLLIERKVLTEGWKAFQDVAFHTLESPVVVKDLSVIIKYSKEYQHLQFKAMSFRQEKIAEEVGRLVNLSYMDFLKE